LGADDDVDVDDDNNDNDKDEMLILLSLWMMTKLTMASKTIKVGVNFTKFLEMQKSDH
jgi:hypothetical protein